MLFRMSRPRAFLPLVLGAAYMTRGQVLELGSLNFSVIRILVLVGCARVFVRGERLSGGLNRLDWSVLIWAAWFLAAGMFHSEDGVILRLGIVWTDLGAYFLFRVFVGSLDDVKHVFRCLCVVVVPIAVAMLAERVYGHNWFAALGGVAPEASLRHGKFRAMGPFAHAILAGTVGAMCVPMAVLEWRSNRKYAIAGLFGSLGMVYASGSSGPALMTVAILAAMFLWRWRERLRVMRWAVLGGLIILNAIMNDPVYFLLARIDITGGSTGWHRAELIRSSIMHLSEWWAVGTDYTRHWMPTGIHANTRHTDITNFYLQMGVWGGLLLMVLFIATLYVAFEGIGQALQRTIGARHPQIFLIWTIGSILFGHIVNFFSISYFDQSIVFFYLTLAIVGMLIGLKTQSAQPVQLEGCA